MARKGNPGLPAGAHGSRPYNVNHGKDVSTPARKISDEAYYRQLESLETLKAGPNNRVTWLGPVAGTDTAKVRVCGLYGPKGDKFPWCETRIQRRSDCDSPDSLARWCRENKAAWVIRLHHLYALLDKLQDRWLHAAEYRRYDYANNHGRAPLPPSFSNREGVLLYVVGVDRAHVR